MGRDKEIRDALAQFAGKYGPHQTALYTVTSVSEADNTCEAIDDDGVEFLVRLMPIITDDQSIYQYPALGKMILAARLEDSGDWFICWAEQWTRMIIKIGRCTLETDGNKWTVKNDDANLKDVFTNIIEAIQVIAVIYGNNPDFAKLAEATTLVNNLLQ